MNGPAPCVPARACNVKKTRLWKGAFFIRNGAWVSHGIWTIPESNARCSTPQSFWKTVRDKISP